MTSGYVGFVTLMSSRRRGSTKVSFTRGPGALFGSKFNIGPVAGKCTLTVHSSARAARACRYTAFRKGIMREYTAVDYTVMSLPSFLSALDTPH